MITFSIDFHSEFITCLPESSSSIVSGTMRAVFPLCGVLPASEVLGEETIVVLGVMRESVESVMLVIVVCAVWVVCVV